MADTGNILQPLSTNHSTTTSPSRSTNKVRILWRGSLILPNGGVPLPGLSIISTHLPSASSSSFSPPRPRRTRIRTADVFGTPITPIEEDVIAGLDERDGEGEGDEAESDLTLAIEVLRHAPLVVQTHTTTACSKKDDLDLDQWVVSSSTSLSLDSAHWSTIDYLHRALLPFTSSSSISRVSLTISPPMQDPVIQPQGTKNGNNKRLLPPAAPFDVFSSPPNEFAIIPVLIPSTTPPPLDKKRSGTASSSQQQTIRLALAQRRRPNPTQAEQTPALPLKHVAAAAAAAAATSTPGERGLSATKKRMTVAARNKNVIAAGAALNSATTGGGTATASSRLRTTTTTTTTTTTSSSLAPSITAAVSSVGGQHLQPVTTSSASSNVPTRTLVRQQIKRLTRYALLSRGMVESPSSSSKSASSSQAAETSAGQGQQDEYGPCLRAIVAATETMLKPDLDALPPGAPMPSLTRIASWVKVHVEMYAPPLPRACIPPGS
ncbi:hypothetical protein A4X09_0g4471 [Tilletia walkeri]|uniref:Sld7 C-terminal domain-containing protein n=1 Tax=Tilletia walkeri TaxID=117179 RepID=A0A8X7T502_9BASI|nr:hypothetical protein A4X09_0g4471 [Tilletia walkeri]